MRRNAENSDDVNLCNGEDFKIFELKT